MKNMRASFQKTLILLLIICGQSNLVNSQEVSNTKTVVTNRSETCRSNPKHTYQVFVPSVDTSFKQLPLLVSIDPHGDGKLAVAGFKEAAQKYQVVVVGSNLIKNNDANYIQELEELIADVKSRYPIGNILFVGGFSGGARMAIGYATTHKVNGVIAYGALAPAKQIAALSCRVISVIGLDDFNFIEVAQLVIDPQQMPSNLFLETTEATHEWPQESVMQQTLGFLLLSTMPPGTPAEKRKIVQEFTAEQRKRIDNLTKAGKNIQAALITRNMFGNPYFEREGSFLNLFDQLSNDSVYQQQVDKLSQSIQFETNIRNDLYSALVEKDSVWWRQDVDMLNSKINTEKDEFMQLAYKRIKGFLGILCYSMCERFSEEKNSINLEKVLMVYRLTEPKNPDVKKFTKLLEQIKKN
jgi:hypothetical protein